MAAPLGRRLLQRGLEPPLGESSGRRGRRPASGWLNSFDGVFYRLGVLTGGYAQDFRDNGNGNLYSTGLTLYSPLSARFELRLDIPFIASSHSASDNDYPAARRPSDHAPAS